MHILVVALDDLYQSNFIRMSDFKRSIQTDRSCDTYKRQSSSQKSIMPHRSRSPRNDVIQRRKRKRLSTYVPIELPFHAHPLVKADYKEYRPVFGFFLDIQKGKNLEELNEAEAKGRWKSFMGKWNRGELSEGWYDPSIKQMALEYATTNFLTDEGKSESKICPEPKCSVGSDSEESIGPTLPGQHSQLQTKSSGPNIPKTQDLQISREVRAADDLARRDAIRSAQRADREEQKAVLDELIPRAEPGTRERQIEKKKEINEKMKHFRDKSPGAADITETELMGGGDDLESYKKVRQEMERKKTEREIRKEENIRARMAEREERLREYRAKEEGTIAMLKALAKQRFG